MTTTGDTSTTFPPEEAPASNGASLHQQPPQQQERIPDGLDTMQSISLSGDQDDAAPDDLYAGGFIFDSPTNADICCDIDTNLQQEESPPAVTRVELDIYDDQGVEHYITNNNNNNNNSTTLTNDNIPDDTFLQQAHNTICLAAWKKRTGLGQFARHGKNWEKRWIVLSGTKLEYFELEDDNNHTNGDEFREPRGTLDLIDSAAELFVPTKGTPNAPSPHELEVTFVKPLKNHEQQVFYAPSEHLDKDAHDMHHHPTTAKPTRISWRFCFDSQSDQVNVLSVAHDILDKGGSFVEKDVERFEHDFHPGDHIFRWELLVVPPWIYPIQIHGIVLEAGRNCVLVADFGLTGYRRKQGADFNHAEDHTHDNKILSAFKKLRPKDKGQRLNLRTMTDPHEIRKWSKASYKDVAGSNKSSHSHSIPGQKQLGKFAKSLLKSAKAVKGPNLHLEDELNVAKSEEEDTTEKSTNSDAEGRGRAQTWDAGHASSSEQHEDMTEDSIHSDAQPKKKQPKQGETPLPKSDPVKIVLSRVHFLLECPQDSLPPYHVLFSNSECIAVWCKTGRWSTLQAAVFLSTNSVGAAKTSTVATLGVAAAHAILAPVVVVGGLLWVSAPMVILQKSREKWLEYTQLMTDRFWQDWAPNEVFVEAIQQWSELEDCHPRDDHSRRPKPHERSSAPS